MIINCTLQIKAIRISLLIFFWHFVFIYVLSTVIVPICGYLNLKITKYFKIQYSVTLDTFQVLNSHTWLVATEIDQNRWHCYHCKGSLEHFWSVYLLKCCCSPPPQLFFQIWVLIIYEWVKSSYLGHVFTKNIGFIRVSYLKLL